MILFHSGDLGDSTSFWPLTHFGTQEAAMDRARNRCQEYLEKNKAQPATYMYECEVDLTACRIAASERDWDWPSGLALILELYRLKQLPNPETQSKATLHIRNARGDAQRERELCFDFLRRFDIGAVSYLNCVEDPGVISYCVINPALVTILNREEIFNNS